MDSHEKNEESPVSILAASCLMCTRCIKVCPTGHLIRLNDQIAKSDDPAHTCILCGHCMASCNSMSITIEGFNPDDFIELPRELLKYDTLLPFLQSRRSRRHFLDRTVEKEVIQKVIDAAKTAPMGIPPSNVEITVVYGKKKVKELVEPILDELKKWDYAFSNKVITGAMSLMGQGAMVEMMSHQIIPLVKGILKKADEGEDFLTYDAPVLMLFHADRRTDSFRENSIIAMTIGMLAAESLGLGNCIIGMIPPAVDRSKKLREILSIPKDNSVVCSMILGYPAYKFGKLIPRQFKSESWVE